MLALASAAVLPVATHAQTFRGVVVDDSTKRPLENVTVSLLDINGGDLGRSVRTDSAGRYLLSTGVSGVYRVKAIHLGYQALTSEPNRSGAADVVTINFSMSIVPHRLGNVVVSARTRLSRDDLLSIVGFEVRRSRGVGVFLDTVFLRDYKEMPMAFVLQDYGMVPHVYLVGFMEPLIKMAKGTDSCNADIFIDGWNVNAKGPKWGAMRLFGVSADLIYAVEVYNRGSLPPPSLGAEIGGNTSCGAIVVWTKAFHEASLKRERKPP
jgi:hypothetical protein